MENWWKFINQDQVHKGKWFGEDKKPRVPYDLKTFRNHGSKDRWLDVESE